MKQNFVIVIIGGGAAGIMAAISAKQHHPGSRVVILDQTFALGRKILVSGAGRCNLTNSNLEKSPEKYYNCTNPDFVKKVFDQFGYNKICDFFQDELGVELTEDKKTKIGKIFPKTNEAKTVVALLVDYLEGLGVEIILSFRCRSVRQVSDKSFEITGNDGNMVRSDKLILACGGKTYPALGSDGSGFALATALGHEIIAPVPVAVPLVAKNLIFHEAQGTKLEAEITAGRHKAVGDVLFTKYGLSGSAVLNISRDASVALNRDRKSGFKASLNFFPGKNDSAVKKLFTQRWKKRPAQTVLKSLIGLLPERVAMGILRICEIDAESKIKDISSAKADLLFKTMTDLEIVITDTRGWNEAEFTAGGVNIQEVKSGTLESKIINNLYFCGEILDVDGPIGGYNLSWAWSSGWVAGKIM
jgi:predicted Rossmann fold flavoprotein